jgi:hypothetical protein
VQPKKRRRREQLHDRLTTSTEHTTIAAKSTASSVIRNQSDAVPLKILAEASGSDQCSNLSDRDQRKRPESHESAAGKPALRQQKFYQASLQ